MAAILIFHITEFASPQIYSKENIYEVRLKSILGNVIRVLKFLKISSSNPNALTILFNKYWGWGGNREWYYP